MKKICYFILLLPSLQASAQNDRLNDFNNTNWLQTINTIVLSKQWSMHIEYQWRRENGLKSWQQSLLRIGSNYKLHDNVTIHAGYAWVETFSYGDHPIASTGTFPEHRVYEQLVLRQPVSKWTFIHRFRVEQRWLGRVVANTGSNREIEGWNFLHRFRYQFRTQYPFYTKGDKQFYGAAADEIFIGAGKNAGVNIFDQNRVFLLLGYRISKRFSLEAGYFNQTLQQGRRIANNTIMQRNNGVVITSLVNL